LLLQQHGQLLPVMLLLDGCLLLLWQLRNRLLQLQLLLLQGLQALPSHSNLKLPVAVL
jgi:hypothetical protein